MSDLHDFAIFGIKNGVICQNFDFLRSYYDRDFLSDFAEIFTWVVFEVEKFVDQVRFAWFCHFQGENWGQRSKFWLLWGQNWSEISTFNSILTLKMTKLCKSDITSKFLDLESYSGKNYIKIREKNSGPNMTSNS